MPGFAHGPWNGMLAPAGTPAAVGARLDAALVKILQSLEVEKALDCEGAEPAGNSPGELDAIVGAQTAERAKVIRAAGIAAG